MAVEIFLRALLQWPRRLWPQKLWPWKLWLAGWRGKRAARRPLHVDGLSDHIWRDIGLGDRLDGR